MDLHLQGKVVMVAAASRGLGYGIAQAVAAEGARVSICSRSAVAVEAAALRLHEETGAMVLPVVADMTDPQAIQHWVETTLARFDRIDGLVTNAGGPHSGTFDTFSDDDWQAAFELTLLSVVRLVRAVLPSMRRQGYGAILTLTSTSVKEPIDNLLLSNVLRSGVTSLAKSLSRQLAAENIRVNNLVPGRIATERVAALDDEAARTRGISTREQRRATERNIPLGRYGTAEEFGRAAAFLLSDAASYITGATLTVDGGMVRTVW